MDITTPSINRSRSSRCWVEIDLSALERNLLRIRSALPSWIRYVAVVKADAYGHGIAPVATRLMRGGTDLFAVANVREAIEIREIGVGWPILVLSPVLPDEAEAAVDWDLIPAVSGENDAAYLANAARRRGRSLLIHLKIDTGMGRLGIWHEHAGQLIEGVQQHPELIIGGIFTHFTSADTDPEFTQEQRRRFLNLLSQIPVPNDPGFLIHADNSAGIETLARSGPFNAVRIGLLQFGISPYPGSFLGHVVVDPVLSFHSRVGLVKSLPAGTGISYGQTCRLLRNSRLAIMTAGYADGIPTALSNRGSVLIRGHRCPILGRVTMDQVVIDVTDIPSIEAGEPVTIIGRQGSEETTVADFCSWSGQIPWEVLVTITKRVQRIYRSDSAV